MSIGLAMSNIGFYTEKYDYYTGEVNKLQAEVMAATAEAGGQPNENQRTQIADIRKRLAAYMALQGLVKEFLDYWKQVQKDDFALIKSLQEILQGAR